MIEQFFTEEEGPDRDWQKYDYDVFQEDDRDELADEDWLYRKWGNNDDY